MRTEDVLDSIDHALEDWNVSPDAMRWTPELVSPAPARRPVSFHVAVDLRPFMQAVSDVAQTLGRWTLDFQQAVGRATVGMEQFADAIQQAEQTEREQALAITEPRERALALLRARNTGPSRDLVKQRRPRKVSV